MYETSIAMCLILEIKCGGGRNWLGVVLYGIGEAGGKEACEADSEVLGRRKGQDKSMGKINMEGGAESCTICESALIRSE